MNFLHNRWIQLSVLILFLAAIGANAMRLKYCVLDYDIWWHLKVGDWIVEHFAVPHTGILSRVAQDRPWVAYSWGYEVLLSRAYAQFGLLGIGVFGVALTIGVAFFAYWMPRRLSGHFWLSCSLAALVCSAFLFNGMPRPVFLSEMLYCVTLTLILEAQRSGRLQRLYWLPLLVLIWANLHIQFIYGLFVVGLFVGITLIQCAIGSFGIWPDFLFRPRLPLKPLLLIFFLCILATVMGPNSYHLYLVVLAYTKAKFAYSVIMELQPLSFRGFSNFVELFLAAAGFYAVGWKKKLDPWKISLLVIASAVAFRTTRDAWFICFSAAACIAYATAVKTSEVRTKHSTEFPLGALALIATLFFVAPFVNFDTRILDRAISHNYPVDAVNFLRRTPLRGPLYNNLNWGGFLMWYMPQLPVAVDGRNDLYGDDLDKIFYYSQSGFPSYKTDPYLDEAGVVIIESQLPLAKLLSIDPRFKLIYHDDIATVYVHQ